jgi:hypothetical protein
MRRRELLKGAGASLAALAAPRIGRAERASKLVFVPPIDLSVLDPVVTGIRSTRNHAYLVRAPDLPAPSPAVAWRGERLPEHNREHAHAVPRSRTAFSQLPHARVLLRNEISRAKRPDGGWCRLRQDRSGGEQTFSNTVATAGHARDCPKARRLLTVLRSVGQ